ncbi:hypothetical protein D3C79_911050 [compost metagenome]
MFADTGAVVGHQPLPRRGFAGPPGGGADCREQRQQFQHLAPLQAGFRQFFQRLARQPARHTGKVPAQALHARPGQAVGFVIRQPGLEGRPGGRVGAVVGETDRPFYGLVHRCAG